MLAILRAVVYACGRYAGVYAGGGVILAHAIYGGIYAIWRGGGFLAGYYMADFTGVNGAFFKNVSKST